MNQGSDQYKKIMDGLGKIPGLNLPIPGVSRSGYKPAQVEHVETPPVPSQSLDYSFSSRNPVKESLELDRHDRVLFLKYLKTLHESLASKAILTEDTYQSLDKLQIIALEHPNNIYLQKTVKSLHEAVMQHQLSHGYLKMMIKNAAEFIKSI
jgi:hypothetical protein